MDKKECRKYIRELKRQYTPEEKRRLSQPVLARLEQNERFRNAKLVLGYWSMEDEVDTHDFILRWADKKQFLLPCVRGDELELRYFKGLENLTPGELYAIPEPVGELFTEVERIDFIIVPGVAFDARGHRLGRGKGYYDRILRNCRAYKAGLCFDFQFLEEVPVDEHDISMDTVIH